MALNTLAACGGHASADGFREDGRLFIRTENLTAEAALAVAVAHGASEDLVFRTLKDPAVMGEIAMSHAINGHASEAVTHLLSMLLTKWQTNSYLLNRYTRP